MTNSPVVRLADLPLVEQRHGAAYLAQMARLPATAGAQKMGMRLTIVPPGKSAWPFHAHHVNEEIFVILAGQGTLRLGAATHAIAAGDVVVCPPGGPETAHQIINSGEDELRYLVFSTNAFPDVYEYPDSGKFGVQSGSRDKRLLVFWGRQADGVDYWDGEG